MTFRALLSSSPFSLLSCRCKFVNRCIVPAVLTWVSDIVLGFARLLPAGGCADVLLLRAKLELFHKTEADAVAKPDLRKHMSLNLKAWQL